MATTNDLFIFKYNNYYNRLVKVEDTLAGYRKNGEEVYDFVANFNPGNGVETQILVGTGDYDGKGDYVLVGVFYRDVNTREMLYRIDSRWFILDAERTRGGQYLLTLKRDVVADYYNVIIEAPCFIEKATLKNDNPLIFNQENFQVNQIKQSETLLKDRSDCAWLVGYLSSETSIDDIVVIQNQSTVGAQYIGNIDTWEWYPYSNLSIDATNYINSVNNATIKFMLESFSGSGNTYFLTWTVGTDTIQVESKWIYTPPPEEDVKIIYYNDELYTAEFAIEALRQSLPNVITDDIVRREVLPNYIGDITQVPSKIKDSNDNFYDVRVVNSGSGPSIISPTTPGTISALFIDMLRNINNQLQTEVFGWPYTFLPDIFGQTEAYRLILSQESQYTYTIGLDVNKYRTNDIYRIVCIPYPDEGKEFIVRNALAEDGVTSIPEIRVNRESAFALARSIIQKGGGISGATLVYDFQLLPYCPVQYDYLWEGTSINLSNSTPTEAGYTVIGDKSIVFEVTNPQFTFNIRKIIRNTEPKVAAQCDMYRLCSPNWASIFEFNAAKNGGVKYFNVDCHYKPYNPYIHVNPNFRELYGEDFNDARGLICAGNFSLSSKSDAFINYELNNRNYQLAFDRQIENLEVQFKYQRINELVGGITGTLQGGVSGASAGGMVGGGPGAIAGAVVGTITSATGAIVDYKINEALREEQIAYSKDMYYYDLQNIRARPDTLTQVTALNNNNKIYPVLEYYSCTVEEKNAFRNKIKYNGMSVGIIDKISNYIYLLPSYVKGRIIRLENLDEDFHVANEIAKEINMGVYI